MKINKGKVNPEYGHTVLNALLNAVTMATSRAQLIEIWHGGRAVLELEDLFKLVEACSAQQKVINDRAAD